MPRASGTGFLRPRKDNTLPARSAQGTHRLGAPETAGLTHEPVARRVWCNTIGLAVQWHKCSLSLIAKAAAANEADGFQTSKARHRMPIAKTKKELLDGMETEYRLLKRCI